MKQNDPAPMPASNVEWLRNLIANREEQLDDSRAVEGEFLVKRASLQEELAEYQRNAKPGQAAALAKTTAKLRADIAEVDSGIADARDAQDRLTREILAAQDHLIELQSRDLCQRAVQAVAALAEPAAAEERALEAYIAAIRVRRAAGAKAAELTRQALMALGNDEERMLDYQDIVIARAAGCGAEMAFAVIGALRDISSASGAKLVDDHVQINAFISTGDTPTTAIEAAVRVVASRLNVEVQP